MSKLMIDLHCHSTASDGSLTPTELVRLGRSIGLGALALTDHDTVAGIDEALTAAAAVGLDFLPGIELSAAHPTRGNLHVVGLGLDHRSPALAEVLSWIVAKRDERNLLIIEALRQRGVDITIDDVAAVAQGEVVARPHFARVIVDRGAAASLYEAYERFIGDQAPAYRDRERLPVPRCFEVIHQAGGVAILAHPHDLGLKNRELELLVRELKEQGLDGLETCYSGYPPTQIEGYRRLARRHGLLESGGSDFHGANNPGLKLGIGPGKLHVPDALLPPLREAIARRRSARRPAPRSAAVAVLE